MLGVEAPLLSAEEVLLSCDACVSVADLHRTGHAGPQAGTAVEHRSAFTLLLLLHPCFLYRLH